MKYSEQRELVEDLRTLADFFERPASLALPYPYGLLHEYESVTVNNYVDGKYKMDHEASLAALKKVAKALGKCEKHYPAGGTYAGSFRLRKEFGNGIVLEYSVNGEVTCERKLVGARVVPEQIVKAHTVEEYEYECVKTSLLA